ncbi:hypothetical protein ACFQH9_21965 [Pseudonocardia lutea]|uniref:Peptide zinc metalloprotease protein n=1 Tax=Pseudonocardia lutea TaxID=2172015 RepID=A0ABW1ICW9_9PSEU
MSENGVLMPPAGESRCHHLAEGTELIGEYQASGYQEPKYLIRRADGQVMQLPALLYRLTESLDGTRDCQQLASDLNEQLGTDLIAEQVSFLVEERLRPVGLVAPDKTTQTGENSPAPVRSDPLLALRYRVGVVPASAVWRVAGVLNFFFRRPIWVTALVAFAALDLLVVLRGSLLEQVVAGVEQLIDQPVLTLAIIGLTIVSAAYHECGHAAACRYGGARPGTMGIGLYIVWPAFYTNVTDAYRLDRVGRLRTDLGGVYFNVVFMTGLALLYLDTGQPWLLLALIGLHTETAWQFLPSIRLDGYYILADLIGVPDLFAYIGPVLKGLLPSRPTDPRVRELKLWSRRIIVLWVVLVVPTLLLYLVAFLLVAPRVLPLAWQAVLEYLREIDATIRAGDVVTATLSVFQLFLLVLPWVGSILITGMIARRLGPWAVRRWGRGRVRPGTWTVVRRYAALAGVGVVAVALVARVAQVATTLPGSPTETRLSDSAFAALRLGLSQAPEVAAGALAARQQVSGYTGLTGAYARHASVLTGSRELAVVACTAIVACLLVLAVRWRVRPLAVALPVVAAAAMGPAVGALATVGPGVVGAAWLAVGVVVLAYAGRSRALRVLAGLLVVAAVVTDPLLAVPLAVGVIALAVQRRAWRGRAPWCALAAVLLLALAGLGVALAGKAAAEGGSPDGPEREVLLLVGALVVVGGLAVRRVRPAAAVAGSVVLLAAVPWSGAEGALPLVVVASVILGVLLIGTLGQGPVEARPHPLLRAALAVPAVLMTAVGALFLPVPAPAVPHEELARWITAPASPATSVVVPAGLWADLLRDGVPADRLSAAGSAPHVLPVWTVVAGDPGLQAERVAARFGTGSGSGSLTVLAPAPSPPDRGAATPVPPPKDTEIAAPAPLPVAAPSSAPEPSRQPAAPSRQAVAPTRPAGAAPSRQAVTPSRQAAYPSRASGERAGAAGTSTPRTAAPASPGSDAGARDVRTPASAAPTPAPSRTHEPTGATTNTPPPDRSHEEQQTGACASDTKESTRTDEAPRPSRR